MNLLGHLGFSYIGLLYLLLLIIPNLIWTKHHPKNYNNKDENKILLCFERLGQIGVTCTVLVFKDTNLNGWTVWSIWLFISAILMILYECWWVRYFKSTMRLQDFYSSFLGMPVAGATLPVMAFILLGIYGKVIWIIVSVVILGIGHIGIHLQHLKKLGK